jgi:hypothetical protein
MGAAMIGLMGGSSSSKFFHGNDWVLVLDRVKR